MADPFREVQPLHRNTMLRILLPVSMVTTTAIILAVAAATPPDQRAQLYWVLAGCLGLEIGLLVLFRQIVHVREGEISAVFVPLMFWTRRIPVARLASARVQKVDPISDLGGYGLKWSRKFGMAYLVYGYHGVALEEDGGRRTFIGSQDAEGLLEVIRAHHSEHAPGRGLPERVDEVATV